MNGCYKGTHFTNMDDFSLVSAWMNNVIHHRVKDEITSPISNFNDATVEVKE